MKIGIAVFAYNRSNHLHRVLEGLKKNAEVELVYIFHDGLKSEADQCGWEATRKEIEAVDWCKTKLYKAEQNKGLAKSIVDGIKLVLEENDAVIVLEDDCIPQPSFVSFMRQCFEQYRDNKEVYSVSGYSWPIQLDASESDVYFCGRPCPWGWGTWKDRWAYYQKEYNWILDMKRDKDMSRNLAVWGDDLEDMLVSNIRGITDSWYVFWSLLMIKNNKYAVNPYRSLIQNEGFDGTGEHCGRTDMFQVDQMDSRGAQEVFCLPFEVSIREQTKRAFASLYGSWSVVYDRGEKEDVLIYGAGNYYKSQAKQINEQYNVVAFVDKYKKDKYYAGIEIIHPKQIEEWKYKYIIVTIADSSSRDVIRKELEEVYNIESEKIIIWGKN